jgi:hypothetical protein
MKERPILFTTEMVRAVEEDRKFKTRRVIKPTMTAPRIAPLRMEPWLIDGEQQTDDDGAPLWAGFHPGYPGEAKWFSCPYGQPGDRLWVRETFYQNGAGDFIYRANYDAGTFNYDLKGWRPSIFMPRAASRLLLEVVSVKVERVGDITVEDCKAEGMHLEPGRDTEHLKTDFRTLWDTINAKRGYPWKMNPWVWVVAFKRIV